MVFFLISEKDDTSNIPDHWLVTSSSAVSVEHYQFVLILNKARTDLLMTMLDLVYKIL